MSFWSRSLLLNFLYVLESGTGFFFDVLIAVALGPGVASDALYAGWLIPQSIGRGIFQSLSHSLLGLLAESNEQIDEYGQVLLFFSGIAAAIGLVLSVSSRWWIPLTIAGSSPETQLTAVTIGQVLGFLPFFLAVSETVRVIYYAEGNFIWPSGIRIAGSTLTLILFATLYARSASVTLATWSILIGAAAEALLCVLLLHRYGGKPLRFRRLQMRRLGEYTVVAGAPMLGVAALMFAAAGERFFASFLGGGAITLVSYANRIVTSIERFAFRGFLISATAASVKGEFQERRNQLRVAILYAIPFSVVLLVLASPFVLLVFGHGNFSGEDARRLSLILQLYGIAILGLAVSRIGLGYAFALNRVRVTFYYYVLTALVLVSSEAAAIWMGFGVSSFGIGYVAAMWAGVFFLQQTVGSAMELRWSDIFEWRLWAVFAGTLLATALTSTLLANLLHDTWTARLLLIGFGTGCCMVFLVLSMYLWQIYEFAAIIEMLRRPFFRKS